MPVKVRVKDGVNQFCGNFTVQQISNKSYSVLTKIENGA